MPLDLGQRTSAERYSVINHHVLADLCGLTDHHPHAVVDEESAADGGTGMDFDSGKEPGQLGDQARGKTERRILPQPVRHTVGPNGVQAGVCEKVLKRASSRRVVGPGGIEVFLKPCEEAHKDLSTGNEGVRAKC